MKRIGSDMRKILVILALTLLPAFAWAQSSIKVQGQNIVALDEQFTLTFVIESDKDDSRPSDFNWSPGDDFQLVWGPQTGYSSSSYSRNGVSTTTVQFTYSYILIARREGKFQLPAATATVGGNKISSNPYSIEVVKGGAATAGGASAKGSNQGASSKSRSADISADDLFMRLALSKSTAVIGEPVTAVLKIYQKVDIAGFEDVRFPTFSGFWSQTLEQPTNIEFKREVVGGKIYNSAVLRSWVLVPQQAGELTIDASEITCLVNITVPGRANSIFDGFFDDNIRTIRKRVSTPAVKFNVQRLPAGAPESFGGGVGQFVMTAKLSRDSLAAHEAASLTVTISGEGNVSLLEAPKINFPPDFEVYDVKPVEKTTKGGTYGVKSFEYPFIPRSRGNFTLEPIEWSYYDSKTHKYVTLTTPEMSIPVSGEAAVSSGSQATGLRLPERSGVRNLSEDIRFIRTGAASLSKGTPMLVGRAVYPVLLLIMALGAAGYYLYRLRSARRKADVVGSRKRGATKMALKRLSASKGNLDKNLDGAFYEELHRALLGYISDKFNMPQEDLDKDNIVAKLQERGVSEDLSKQFTDLVDACEFARYSPAAGEGALRAHYDDAVKVISAIDSTMKSRSSAASKAVLSIAVLAMMAPGAMASAEASDSLWAAGVQAYSDGQFQVAVEKWQVLEDDGYISSVLSYNLGNAYFKTGDNARAILHYERALKIDPSFTDARNNLEFANSLIQDRIEVVPEFILETWGRNMCYGLSSNVWAVLSLLFFAALCALVLGIFLAGAPGRRKLCLWGAIAALVLFALTADFAFWQKSEYNAADKAIVTAPVSAVKNSPAGGSSAKDLFVLHEGVKVKVLDSVGSFTNIELSDGRQGWIGSSDIELI